MSHTIFIRANLQSLVFATILQRLLSTSMEILPQSTKTTSKQGLFLEEYNWEYLLMEYERRYGKVQWFHDFQDKEEQLEIAFQSHIEHGGFEKTVNSFTPLALEILESTPKQRTMQHLITQSTRDHAFTWQHILRDITSSFHLSSS